MAADRVDLVDEDDAGRVLLGLLEHVAHARGADADEHLDEVGTGDREERHLGLAGDGLGEQRLTGTGRADQQHAARDLAAELLELAGVAQEFHEFDHFLLGLLDAGDVGEGDLDLVLAEHARAALAEGHRAPAAGAALHLAHEEDPHADQQQHREPGDEDLGQQALLVARLGHHGHAVGQQVVDHLGIVGRIGLETLAGRGLAVDDTILDGHAGDIALFDLGDEFGIAELIGARRRRSETVEHGHQHHCDDHPQNQILGHVVQACLPRPVG
jgi:hypothetical protein